MSEKKKVIVSPVPFVLCDVPPSLPEQARCPLCPKCGAEMQEDRWGSFSCFNLGCEEEYRKKQKALAKRVQLKVEGAERFLWD